MVVTSRTAAATGPESIKFVDGAKSCGYDIVVDDKCGPSYRQAAEELRDYLEKITGVRLPIVTQRGVRSILLEKGDAGLGDDGFRLRAEGGNLRISGGKRGILYGVYELLETYGGCGWYSSRISVVPKAECFSVPKNLDITDKPAFEYRDTDFCDVGRHRDLGVKLRYNGMCSGPAGEDRLGGAAGRFVGGLSCHTFYTLLPPDVWFDAHPEYYSEINGVRRNKGAQLCLSNPDIVPLVVAKLRECVSRDERVRKDPSVWLASVSQNDCMKYCECSRCREIAEQEGAQSGVLIRFVNKVAEEIERTDPDLIIHTFAYQYTRKPPKLVRPRHNVIVQLCLIECVFSDPLEKRTYGENAAFMDDFDGWSRISNRFFFWDYAANFWHYIHPMPNVHVMKSNLQLFHQRGVRYLFEEGITHEHGDFAELKTWILSKLMWNPNQPVKPLLERFFTAFYGPAAPYVREYFYRCEKAVATVPQSYLMCFTSDRPKVFPDEFLEWALDNFDKAIESVKDDPVRQWHVRWQAASPLLRLIDRVGQNVRYVWVTRDPQNVRDLTRYQPRVRQVKELWDEAKRRGESVQLGPEHYERPSIDIWRRILEFSRPTNGCDRVVVGVGDFIVPSSKLIVSDSSALGGKAVVACNYSEAEAMRLHFGNVAYDRGVRYRVRFHAKVERAVNGRGEAFCATLGTNKSHLCVAPKVETVKDCWQWYDFEPLEFTDDMDFKFASGRFSEGGGRGAVNEVRIDSIEILRADK